MRERNPAGGVGCASGYNRRTLLWAAAAGGLLTARAQESKMRLGIILGVGREPDAAIQRVHDLGLPTCQVGVHDTGGDAAANLRRALDRYGVEATSAVAGETSARVTAEALLAPLASPALTGTPTAPTGAVQKSAAAISG